MAASSRSIEPSVSVIIAAFNQEQLVTQLLEGLAQQTWQGRLEVVVADNTRPTRRRNRPGGSQTGCPTSTFLLSIAAEVNALPEMTA